MMRGKMTFLLQQIGVKAGSFGQSTGTVPEILKGA